MSQIHCDVLVIGGGLHGLCSALHLARGGARVVLVERRWLGRHASGATAAGVRSLNRHPSEIEITRAAIPIWHRITELVGDDCGFHANGQIRIGTDADLEAIEARAGLSAGLGWSHEEVIGRPDLAQVAPGLAEKYRHALYVRDDGSADPHRTVSAFRAACVTAGVTIHEGQSVLSLERLGSGWQVRTEDLAITSDVVVNAAGAWARDIAAMAGQTITMKATALMMMVTERMAPVALPVVGVMGRKLSLKQTDCGTVLLGGALEGHCDTQTEVSQVRAHELHISSRNAIDAFPALKNIIINRFWTGIEAMSPDGVPVIGASKQDASLIHCFGFSAHGFALVPIVGALVAALYQGQKPSVDLTPFDPDRPAVRAGAA